MVGLNNRPADREPEPHALGFGRKQRLEDLIELALLDARPIVLDGDLDAAGAGFSPSLSSLASTKRSISFNAQPESFGLGAAMALTGTTADATAALRARGTGVPRDVAFFSTPSFMVGRRRREAYARSSLALVAETSVRAPAE